MSNENIWDTLTDRYPDLTRSAKKVADYVFQHRVEIEYMSITALAEECGVAEATIFRFCQTLGFSGYNSFKLALAKTGSGYSSSHDFQPLHGSIGQGDSFEDMCQKLYTRDVAAIGQTLAQLDQAAIATAVGYIGRAPHVYCFGQGGSLVMAMEAWARFMTAASNFHCIEDSHMQAMAAGLACKDDVILFFSYSGATNDMMDVMQVARKRGAKIILVTHFKKSPGASLADIVLLCGSIEAPLQSGSVAVKMGLLFLIDILFNEYCRQFPRLTKENLSATVDAIAGKLL